MIFDFLTRLPLPDYRAALTAGVLLGTALALWTGHRNGLPVMVVVDGVLAAAVGGLLLGRLGYVAAHLAVLPGAPDSRAGPLAGRPLRARGRGRGGGGRGGDGPPPETDPRAPLGHAGTGRGGRADCGVSGLPAGGLRLRPGDLARGRPALGSQRGTPRPLRPARAACRRAGAGDGVGGPHAGFDPLDGARGPDNRIGGNHTGGNRKGGNRKGHAPKPSAPKGLGPRGLLAPRGCPYRAHLVGPLRPGGIRPGVSAGGCAPSHRWPLRPPVGRPGDTGGWHCIDH
jgi:hypothetical protein